MIALKRDLVLGLGMKRGTPRESIARAVEQVLTEHGLSHDQLLAIATSEHKRNEPGLAEFASAHGLPIRYFALSQLSKVAGVAAPSLAVLRHVGATAVAEPAALLLARTQRLLVGKTVYRDRANGYALTVAVARVRRESSP